MAEKNDAENEAIIEYKALQLVEGWKKQLKRELKLESRTRRRFAKDLLSRWGDAIELLEAMRSICIQVATTYDKDHRENAVEEQDIVFDTLGVLYAHACMVAGEIIALLKQGYAHGAYSRWRTLHELVVLAFFILEQGNDVAEKYLLYDGIEAYQAITEYEQKYKEHTDFFVAGGFESPDEDEKRIVKEHYEELRSRFGDDYANLRNDYGWAAEALGDRRPTFKTIEAVVGFSYLRPFYGLANKSVHATPSGMIRNLGHPLSEIEKPPRARMRIMGPSIYGLADPGQGTAITLYQMTYAFMSRQGVFDEAVTLTALRVLMDETVEAFIKVNDELEKQRPHEEEKE